jgi:hypothetical protein
MESSARLFTCARCRAQVLICRRCDRGNIYLWSGVLTASPARVLEGGGTALSTHSPGPPLPCRASRPLPQTFPQSDASGFCPWRPP